ncbi:hypothetical protein [Rhodococcus sp. OK302]|nr:hypothetical protein [Rhodococcus sp. OK302]
MGTSSTRGTVHVSVCAADVLPVAPTIQVWGTLWAMRPGLINVTCG